MEMRYYMAIVIAGTGGRAQKDGSSTKKTEGMETSPARCNRQPPEWHADRLLEKRRAFPTPCAFGTTATTAAGPHPATPWKDFTVYAPWTGVDAVEVG